jgi:hypothetical protein
MVMVVVILHPAGVFGINAFDGCADVLQCRIVVKHIQVQPRHADVCLVGKQFRVDGNGFYLMEKLAVA